MALVDHVIQLRKALLKACQEHEAPNSFAFSKLHAHHKAPRPALAGRAVRLITSLGNGLVVSVKDGRIVVEREIHR
jgi:hypothetical protein